MQQQIAKLGLSLLLVLVALAPGRAIAFASNFVLETGVSLASGSGVRQGSTSALYQAGTAFPVELTGVTEGFSAEVQAFFIPEIVLPLGGDIYSFVLLDQGVPTDRFTLTIVTPGGDINPGLADPPLEVEITRTFDGSPAGSEIVSLPLSTGEIQVPQCGSSPPITFSGAPLDLATGAVDLVGATCVQQFAGDPFGAILRIRLVGTLPIAPPVPSLSTGAQAALAGLLGGIALAGLRRPRASR
jgi:hypothetical protein